MISVFFDDISALWAAVSRLTPVFFFALLLPQLSGIAANRLLSLWEGPARMVGVAIPTLVIIIVLTTAADLDIQRQRALGITAICATPIMSTFILVPVHVIAALFAQAVMPYGRRGRAQ